MSFMNTGAVRGRPDQRKTPMIAQRQNVQSRVKCWREKGLTWPGSDAYDWLLVTFLSLGDKAL
jgi:hypothetical protein